MASRVKLDARVKTSPKGSCYDCRKPVRSLIEHRTTAVHLASRTSIKDTGPKGRHPYRPPMMGYDVDAHYAWLEEQYLATLPPSIDDVFPTEIRDPLPESAPAVRAYTPSPCERCGKTFKTDAGARWHATNNQDCKRWQRKATAA